MLLPSVEADAKLQTKTMAINSYDIILIIEKIGYTSELQ